MSIDSFAPVDPKLIDTRPDPSDLTDGQSGYPDHLAAEDTPDALRDACGSASRDFPSHLWIEPKHWAEKARENDEYNTWPLNYVDRFTNQSPTHECTCHALRVCYESAWNRQRGVIYPDGPKRGFRYEESATFNSLWVSCMSIYNEANPNIRGGANIRQVLNIALRRGFLPDNTQPGDLKFKHSMPGTQGQGNSNQSSGSWVSVRNMPDDWQETAKHLKPQEVILNLDTWEQAVCLVLHGIGWSVGRDGHAITWMIWNESRRVLGYPDSYDVMRYDSERTARYAYRGGYGIASVVTPDSWDKPVPEDLLVPA